MYFSFDFGWCSIHFGGDIHTHFAMQNINQMFYSFKVDEWVKIYIFIMTFRVTKCFQRKSHFTRKIILNKKYYTAYAHLFSISSRYFVSCTWRVFKFTLVISLRKKAPTLPFYSSQYAENRREKTTSYLCACIFRNHIAM